MTEGPTPSRVHTPWMVWAFVVFALLQAVAWIRLLTLETPAPCDGTNADAWGSYARWMCGTGFLSGAGGGLVCLVFAVVAATRRAPRAIEHVLWFLVAPAMTVPGWIVWYPIALGV